MQMTVNNSITSHFPEEEKDVILHNSAILPLCLVQNVIKSEQWPAHILSSQSEQEIFLAMCERFRTCLATVSKAFKCKIVLRLRLCPTEC